MVVICHREAAWVSPASGSEKAEDFKVGARLTSIASLMGETLLGVLGTPEATVVKEVSVDQPDQLP